MCSHNKHLKLFLASGFYLGLAPLVPGSFGALTGLLWHALACAWALSELGVRMWCFVGILIFSILHYWLTPWAQDYWQDPDPRHFVLDEIVGYLCVPLFWYLPNPLPFHWSICALFGFLVFRILDAIKLPLARYIDREIHTASGVLFDDVVSAAYTAVVVSLVLWFVAPPKTSAPLHAQGVKPTTFRRTLERAASMDPIRSASVTEACSVCLVYEPFLEVDYFKRPYTLKPGLCFLPTVSSDGLSYTFQVRPDVRFHDDPCFLHGKGRPVVASDLVYTLNRLRGLYRKPSEEPSTGTWTMACVTNVLALGARHVQIQLKQRQHVFPWLMSMAYVGVVPHEAVTHYGTDFGNVAVGTGPYRLTEWWRGHRMRFTREKTWRGWKEIPTTPYEEIEYLVVDDASTKLLMFLSGETDLLGEVSNDNWDAVVKPTGELVDNLAQKGVHLYGSGTMSIFYVGFNMDDPLYGKNKKLRQALNCAFDFDAWNRFLNHRLLRATGPLPPGVAGRLETPFAYSFNLDKARTLLREAGYPDGIDPKTNRRLELHLSTGRADQGAREQMELLQSFYARIGVRLEADYMTWSAFLDAVNKGASSLFFLGWIGDYPDAENFLQLFHSRNVSPGANHGNYRNSKFDALYDAAMVQSDATTREKLWREAQEIIREDCPWIFLHVPKVYALGWERLQHYIPTDFAYGTEKYLSRASSSHNQE